MSADGGGGAGDGVSAEQQEEREKKLCLASQNRRFQTRVRELPGKLVPIVCQTRLLTWLVLT
jgi:hypothetical protein